MKRAVVKAAVDAFDATMKEIGGCSDGYCSMTGPAKGMHTNGGCRCSHDPYRARRALAVARRLREQLELALQTQTNSNRPSK